MLNSETSYITGETNNDKKTDYVYIACWGKKHLHSQKIQNTSKGIRLGVAELLRKKVALFWVK